MKRRAFTLLEVMVAIAILAFALVSTFLAVLAYRQRRSHPDLWIPRSHPRLWSALFAAALSGAQHIARALPRCYAAGGDVSARTEMLLGAHLAGAALATRSGALSSTMHTLGTIALGAGIALTGQIFNLEEHWPGGVMLWALGAWLARRMRAENPGTPASVEQDSERQPAAPRPPAPPQL